MSLWKLLLIMSGVGMILTSIGILTHDLAMEIQYRRAFITEEGSLPAIPKARWLTAAALAVLGWAPLLIAIGLATFGIS